MNRKIRAVVLAHLTAHAVRKLAYLGHSISLYFGTAASLRTSLEYYETHRS